MVARTRCCAPRSTSQGSLFQRSHLTFQEVLYLTFDILRREPAHQIEREHHFSRHTIAEWGMFCRETMLVYLEGCCEKLGGPNKTVEIDESKFGRRKYHRGHTVKGQWVFGGIERESGGKFLLPLLDRTAKTRALSVTGSNPAPRSSAMVGLRLGLSLPRFTRIAPLITPSRSPIPKPGIRLIQSSVRGVTWRLSSNPLAGRTTTKTISHVTCLLCRETLKESISSLNSRKPTMQCNHLQKKAKKGDIRGT